MAGGEPSCLARISAKVNAAFLNFFYNVGFRIAMSPLKWTGGVVLFAAICGMGWSQIRIENRPERLYTPQGSQSFMDKEWTEKNFGFGSRMVSVSIVGEDPETENVITRENLGLMFDLWEEMNEMTMTYNGTEESLETLCTKNAARTAEQQCIRQSPLAFWGYDRATFDADKDIMATINSITSDCCGFGPFVSIDRVFGSTNSMEQGKITRAGAMNMNFFLDQDRVALVEGEPANDQKAMKWETAFAKLVRNDKARKESNLAFHPITAASFDEAVDGTFAADGMLVSISYMVITAYASYVLWKNNNVLSEASLGPLCVLCVGLAVVAGFGLVMLFRPFSLVVNSVVFVMLGIGVDDAFVILASIERVEKEGIEFDSVSTAVEAFGPNSNHPAAKLEPEIRALVKKVAGGVALAGASISLTSLTDFVAFVSGASTVIPALSSFCIYASVTIMFDFFMQCTLFVAFVTFKERSKQKGLRDCLATPCGTACCGGLCGPCVSKNPNGTTYVPCGKPASAQVNPVAKPGASASAVKGYARPREANESFSKRLIGRHLPDLILRPAGKIFVLLLTVGLLAVGGLGCSRLRMEFLYDWFLPSDHWMADSFAVKKRYFTGVNLPFAVYTKDITEADKDYWSQRVELSTMVEKLGENKWVLAGSVDSWQSEFHKWKAPAASSAEYHTDLKSFLSQPIGARYADDVKMSEDGSKVTASRISAMFIDPDGATQQIKMMDDTRAVADTAGSFHCISYTYPMLFWEGLKVVNGETMRNVILAASMVFIVCVVVLADILAAFIVLAVIAMIDILLLGFIHWIGDYMNMVTAINLLLAIGLCVDYSAHICHAFLAATGTRDERARAALFNIGVPVFNGALTTLLATITLSLAQSYVFQVFFRMFMLIVCFGVYFGMVVLPVILSVIGPPSHNAHKQLKSGDVEMPPAAEKPDAINVKSAQ